jgi:plasmid stability protein
MSHTIALSDETYQALHEAAQRHGQSVEELLQSFLAGEQEPRVFDDLDAFFRSFGASEDEIRDSERLFQEREQAKRVAQDSVDDADV